MEKEKKNEELFCSMPVPQAILTLAVPLFMFMTALANLFGVGGASLISRFLGGGERKKASCCGAFCIWTAAGISVLYAGCDPHSVCLQPWRGPGHYGASVYTGVCREQAVHQ